MPDYSEQRRRPRKAIDQEITVSDAVLGEDLGRIVNVHEDGFMIIGGGSLRRDCIYQLLMIFTDEHDEKCSLSLGAECLWLKETDSGTQYWAGFTVIDIGEKDREKLARLI